MKQNEKITVWIRKLRESLKEAETKDKHYASLTEIHTLAPQVTECFIQEGIIDTNALHSVILEKRSPRSQSFSPVRHEEKAGTKKSLHQRSASQSRTRKTKHTVDRTGHFCTDQDTPVKTTGTVKKKIDANKDITLVAWQIDSKIEEANARQIPCRNVDKIDHLAQKMIRFFIDHKVISQDKLRDIYDRLSNNSPRSPRFETAKMGMEDDLDNDCRQQLKFDKEDCVQTTRQMSHDQIETILVRAVEKCEISKKKIKKLEETLEEKERNIIFLQKSNATMNCINCQRVEEKCKRYHEQNTLIAVQNYNFQTDIERLQAKLTEAEKYRQFLLEKEKAMQGVIENKGIIILEIQKRCEDANEAITHYIEEAQRYKIAREEACQKLTTTLYEKEETNKLLSKIRREKDELCAKFNNLETEICELKAKLSKFEKEKKEEMQIQLNNLKSSLRRELEQTKQSKEDLCVRIKDLESKGEKNEILIDSLNKKLKRAEKQQKQVATQREKHDLEKELKIKKKLYAENEHLKESLTQQEHKLNAEKDLCRNEINHYKCEIERLKKKLQTIQLELDDTTVRKKEQESLATIEQDLLNNEIKNLKGQLMGPEGDSIRCERLASGNYMYYQELLDQKIEDLSEIQRSLTRVQEQLQISQRECLSLESEKSELIYQLKDLKRQLQESENSYPVIGSKRLSDIEKENETLKAERLETLKSLGKIRNEHKDLERRFEIDQKYSSTKLQQLEKEKQHLQADNNNLKDQMESIQEQVEANYAEKKSFLQEKDKLNDDKEIMRNEIYSLQEKCRKIEANAEQCYSLKAEYEKLQSTKAEMDKELNILQTKYNTEIQLRTNVDNTKATLSKENDRLRKERNSARLDLQRVLREKEAFIKSLDSDKNASKGELEKLQREKADLIALLKEHKQKWSEKIKQLEIENESLQARFNTEKEVRISTDDTKTKLWEENERLRKERDAANNALNRNIKQKEEIEKILDKERSAYTTEIDKVQKEQNELIAMLTDNQEKDKEKIQRLERENDSLHTRLTGEKANQHNAYEMMQLRNDLNACKLQKENAEKELKELQQENNELETKIENLESTLQQLETCENKVKQLERKNQELHDSYVKKTEELQMATDIQNNKKREHEEKMKILLQKNSDLESQLSSQQFSVSRDNKKIGALKEEIDKLQSEKLDLNLHCRQIEGVIHKKDKENDELRSKMKKEKEEKDKLNSQLEILSREKNEMEGKLRTLLECKNCIALQLQLNKLKDENTEIAKRNNQQKAYGEKLENEKRQLNTDKSSLESFNIILKQEKNTLTSKLEILQTEKVELEERLRRKSPQVVPEQKSCTKCFEYRNEISNQKREINDLRDRLSEAAGNKLRDNNPNIADLSDMNRPTSLAEKFSSLYTDEYTDAMEVIEESLDEAGCVRVMLQWLTSCYDLCKTIAVEQRDELKFNAIGFMKKYHHQHVDLVLTDRCLIYVKEFQKKIASESLEAVGKICHMKTVTEESLVRNNFIIKYIKKCTELCWMMQISDPPLYLNFDVKKGENLDKNVFNVFTHSGSKINYLVWPALYLHTTGPMLAKGVAQGM